ncbi:MAG: hypothetical protein KAQ66_12630 [Rhodospirillaceae bacterium]|nr:hypothetical protein [Rhodospirillaceae bacterium]
MKRMDMTKQHYFLLAHAIAAIAVLSFGIDLGFDDGVRWKSLQATLLYSVPLALVVARWAALRARVERKWLHVVMAIASPAVTMFFLSVIVMVHSIAFMVGSLFASSEAAARKMDPWTVGLFLYGAIIFAECLSWLLGRRNSRSG